MIESLESRRLMSHAPIPSLVGEHRGSFYLQDRRGEVVAEGGIDIDVTSQSRLGAFKGTYAQDDGVVGTVTGTITRRGVVTLAYRGAGFVGIARGTEHALSLTTREYGQVFHGSLTT